MSTWMPGYREDYEMIVVDDDGAERFALLNDGTASEQHLLEGNCFPLGTITAEHLEQVNALIRSFGNEKT